MTDIDRIILVSGIARMLEKMSDDRIAALWMECQDEDAITRGVFKDAAHAVRMKRFAMAEPANKLAA